jgi:hypothetical protein
MRRGQPGPGFAETRLAGDGTHAHHISSRWVVPGGCPQSGVAAVGLGLGPGALARFVAARRDA